MSLKMFLPSLEVINGLAALYGLRKQAIKLSIDDVMFIEYYFKVIYSIT